MKVVLLDYEDYLLLRLSSLLFTRGFIARGILFIDTRRVVSLELNIHNKQNKYCNVIIRSIKFRQFRELFLHQEYILYTGRETMFLPSYSSLETTNVSLTRTFHKIFLII